MCLLILNIFFLTIKMQIVVMTCKLVISVANYDFSASWWLQSPVAMATFKTFALCVLSGQKTREDTNMVDTYMYFAIDKNLYIEVHVLFPIAAFDWTKKLSKLREFSDNSLTTLSLLGFRGYVSENDFSHAVRGWLSCEVILNVPLLFGFALL